MLDKTNNCLDKIIFHPGEVLRILDLRSLGYYNIKQGVFQQNLCKYYRFEKAEVLCEQFNKYKYIKERKTGGDKRKISIVRS